MLAMMKHTDSFLTFPECHSSNGSSFLSTKLSLTRTLLAYKHKWKLEKIFFDESRNFLYKHKAFLNFANLVLNFCSYFANLIPSFGSNSFDHCWCLNPKLPVKFSDESYNCNLIHRSMFADFDKFCWIFFCNDCSLSCPSSRKTLLQWNEIYLNANQPTL